MSLIGCDVNIGPYVYNVDIYGYVYDTNNCNDGVNLNQISQSTRK